MSQKESDLESGGLDGPIVANPRIPNWAFWGTILAVIVILTGFVYKVTRYPGHNSDYRKAVQNLKQVGYALYHFELDCGSYPNDKTAEYLLAKDPQHFLSSAGGSNAYFSQLIAAGYVDQETPFYARTGATLNPDNDRSSPDKLLAKGEVGFAYVVWEAPEENDKWLGAEPLAIAYLEKNRRLAQMQPSGGNKRAIVYVLRQDMSVIELKPTKDGMVHLNGKPYFDWSQPHWRGQKPKIVWPE